jgi:TonB family protein
MSTSAPPSSARRKLRYLGCVVLVFLFQVALIFWFSDQRTSKPRQPRHIPIIRLADLDPAEVLQQHFEAAEPALQADFDRATSALQSGDYGAALDKLTDLASNSALSPEQQLAVKRLFNNAREALENPAMFALPNPLSFSGEAWMTSPPPVYREYDWSEAPRWLPLQMRPVDDLLAGLTPEKPRANETLALPARPEFNQPGMLRLRFLPTASTLQVFSSEPDIIAEPMPELPAQKNSDLLTNSVVQVTIDSKGKAFSATLLSSSGSKPADEEALRIARELKYKAEATAREEDALPTASRWARLVFEWHTVPVSAGGPGGAS